MVSLREDEDPFEEDIVFDQERLLCSRSTKMKSAIHRVSSGKCVLFAKTLGLCGAFFGMGLCTTIPDNTFSSTITELHKNVSPSMSLFTSRSCGYLIGAAMAGFLFDRYNRLFLLFVSLLMTSALITFTPWCQALWLLQTLMVVIGITLGFLTTGGNVLCLDLWGRNSGPFMQAIHFSFALGCLVAPLISVPTVEPVYQPNNNISNTSDINDVNLNYNTTITNYAKDDMNRRVVRELRDINLIDDHNQTNVYNDFSASKFTVSSSVSLSDLSKHIISYSTESYSSTTVSTTKRTPKPKPKLINGAKLDHTRNWDNVPVRKPPKEDLIPVTHTPSTTSASHKLSPKIIPSTNQSVSGLIITVAQTTVPYSKLDINNITTINVTDLSMLTSSSTKAGLGSNNNNNITDGSRNVTTKTKNPQPIEIGVTANRHKNLHLYSAQEKESDLIHNFKNLGVASDKKSLIETQALPSTEKANISFQNSQFHTNREGVSHQSKKIISAEESKPAINETEHNFVNKTTLMLDLPMSTINNLTKSEIETTSNRPTEFSPSVTEPMAVHHIHHLKPGTYDNDTEDVNTLFGLVAHHVEKYGFNRIQFTYLMVGLFVFVVSLVFLGFLCTNPRDPKSKQEEHCGKSERMSNWYLQLSLVLLVSWIFFLCVGLEVTVCQLIVLYAINGPLHLSFSYVSNIQTSFWASFTAMRFSSIFCSSGLRPSVMLGLNMVFCSVGTGLLSTLAFKFESALLIGCSLIGIGVASVVPSGILWLERYIYISNKIAALLVFSSGLGQILCPRAVYSIIASNPDMFLYTVAAINILCVLTAIILVFLTGKYGEKYCTISHVGYQLANQVDEEDMLDMASVQPIWRHRFSLHNGSLSNGHAHLRQ